MNLNSIIEQQRLLRQDNKAIKLLEIIWKNPGISRRDIGLSLKLSKGCVATNVNQILENGYITEGKAINGSGGGAGRNAVGLYIKPDLFYAIGIVATSECAQLALFNARSEKIAEYDFDPKPGGDITFEYTLSMISRYGKKLLTGIKPADLVGVGAAITGIVDFENGDVYSSSFFPNCGNFNLKNFLHEQFGVEGYLTNISHLRPLMEKKWGCARHMNNFITILEPHAAGFFLNGQLYRGWQQHAGEFGYMKICDNPEIGVDGRNGIIETVAPFYKMRQQLMDVINKGGNLKIKEFIKPGQLITKEIAAAAIAAGDLFTTRLMAERWEIIAEGVINVAYLLNPEAIIFEEWTARCPECTLEVVRRKLGSYGLSNWRLQTKVLSAGCPSGRSAEAAAHLAVESVFQKFTSNNGEPI